MADGATETVAAKIAGYRNLEVMENFASGSILSKRLTTDPSMRPGLFLNAHQSAVEISPDLMFGEGKTSHRDFEYGKQISKFRQRDRQRESKEMEELSAFFTHAANPGT
ncbi:hypothetical protein P8C59_007876 [Phyllachora maydis]|uniref:Uncharacterized protein n=1 Tax=Phyllachora maydis TaxID=1825666 RepID=A0AAD9MG16_9PEZI|nr:hypothetical protein P8C59_007876 [Phyllachora maydis]